MKMPLSPPEEVEEELLEAETHPLLSEAEAEQTQAAQIMAERLLQGHSRLAAFITFSAEEVEEELEGPVERVYLDVNDESIDHLIFGSHSSAQFQDIVKMVRDRRIAQQSKRAKVWIHEVESQGSPALKNMVRKSRLKDVAMSVSWIHHYVAFGRSWPPNFSSSGDDFNACEKLESVSALATELAQRHRMETTPQHLDNDAQVDNVAQPVAKKARIDAGGDVAQPVAKKKARIEAGGDEDEEEDS